MNYSRNDSYKTSFQDYNTTQQLIEYSIVTSDSFITYKKRKVSYS